VTDADLVDAITRLPELQQNGRFDRSRLEAYLRGERVPGEFEIDRQSLLKQRLEALVTDGVGVTTASSTSVTASITRRRTSLRAQHAADLAATITLSDEELQKYLDEHADSYRVRRACGRATSPTGRPTSSPGRGEGRQRRRVLRAPQGDKFTEPEQVRARHILIKVAADAGADAKTAARKKPRCCSPR